MSQCPDGLAEWLSAVGTLLAVIVALCVALFSPWIERWWRGTPKLLLVCKPDVLPPDTEGKALVFLCVENGGRNLAERAEVFAKAICRDDSSGSCEEVRGFVPMSLRWAHSEPDHPEVFVTISPDMQRYCVFGALKKGPAPYEETDVYFELWTESKRSKEANALHPGTYRITIILSALGMSPERKEIRVTVPSTFSPEQLLVNIIT